MLRLDHRDAEHGSSGERRPALHEQLYHLDEDYAEEHDLAAEQPDRLRQMIERWWVEAGKYNVLPLDDREIGFLRAAGRPGVRTRFVYYPGSARVERQSSPNITNRSYAISAEVTIPEGGAEGVLLAAGNRFGGYTLFVKDGRLVYEYNFGDVRHVIRSDPELASGAHTWRFDFSKTGRHQGRGRLSIDSTVVGEGDIPRTWPFMAAQAGLHCGRDDGSPVSDQYAVPFAFTGTLHRVVVELADDQQRDPAAEHRAALTEDGIIHGAKSGTVYIDMSSIGPVTTRRVGQALAARGVHMLDVPVGKGPPAAAKGDLTLMVGGDPAVVERVADVLDTLGSRRFYCGPLGAGVTTKLVKNLVSTAICALTGEAMALGVAAGLDPEVMLAVMSNTAANSNHLGNAIKNRVLTGDFSPNFRLSLAHKDLGLAMALAGALGVPSLMGASAYQLHTLAMGAGLGDEDQSATIKVLEACTGLPARVRSTNDSGLSWRRSRTPGRPRWSAVMMQCGRPPVGCSLPGNMYPRMGMMAWTLERWPDQGPHPSPRP